MIWIITGCYNEMLKCELNGYKTPKPGRVELYFPEGQCCDMTGAILLCRMIDSEVKVIPTFAKGRQETVYMMVDRNREPQKEPESTWLVIDKDGDHEKGSIVSFEHNYWERFK